MEVAAATVAVTRAAAVVDVEGVINGGVNKHSSKQPTTTKKDAKAKKLSTPEILRTEI